MKQVISSIALASFLFCLPAGAQEAPKQWSLEECIRYAIENNIDLKQKELERQNQEVTLHTSKYSWLPNLNASINENFGFGRSESKDGLIVDRNSANTSASIQLSMPIFDGFKIPNDIAARKLDLKASIETLNKAKEDLSINVASYYLQVLYNKEMLKIAELQVALSSEQVTKTEALYNAGKVPESQLYDMKAQLAKDEVTLTESRNNVKLALLDLTQALELERDGENFDVLEPETGDAVEQYMSSIIPPDQVYDYAVGVKPQVKEQEYLLESQKKMLKVAQAGYYPKLNFSAGYSNGYYHNFGDGDYNNAPFSDQLKNNGQKSIGFSLSIPIFNRFQVRNSVRSARIAIHNRELLMENTKKTLYKEIQQAYYNATAAQEKYVSSDKSVDASKIAFSYAEDRYGAGKSTVFEYSEAKTKYAQSLAEQTQAKYNFIFRAKILDFYHGTPITL
ncbi:TolC family protein [Parabacteroides sp. TM07-1AC]|uniref:TolC family protein n=1 Tax=Parabacteroides sp. TM07-1AC TaxID=2292363 RepID=UPI000F00DB29|nr:TolC family protein [Parabacteroides sp. TM07-1AC]RHU29281.1 TolC family protein [Parabacteroides sp. TM07-1AC]